MRNRFPSREGRQPLPGQSPVPTRDNLLSENTFVSAGRIQGGDPAGDGWILDLDGLRFYDEGVETINLESAGGSLSFTGDITGATITGGTIRTAASGGRVELTGEDAQVIALYTETAGQSSGLIYTFGGDFPAMVIQSPTKTGEDTASISLLGGDSSVSWPASVILDAGGDEHGQVQLNIASDGGTQVYFRPGPFAEASTQMALISPDGTGTGALKVQNGEADKVHIASNDDSAYITVKAAVFEVADGPVFRAGAGSPEGVVTAPPGSVYGNASGGAGVSLYVKESGTGNTGWVAK